MVMDRDWHGRGGIKTGTTTGYVSGEIAGMSDIFIRSHAIIDYVTGALLILLPFAIPHLDKFDEDDRALTGCRAPAARNEGDLA